MNSKNTLTIVCASLSTLGLLTLLLFVIFWQYHAPLVDYALYISAAFLIVVIIGGKALTLCSEYNLRERRVNYQREIPLDDQGAPYYLFPNMRQAHYTHPDEHACIPTFYAGYQQQQGRRYYE